MTRFERALNDWRSAFENHQKELALKSSPKDGKTIQQITAERFASEGRAALIALLESQKARAGE